MIYDKENCDEVLDNNIYLNNENYTVYKKDGEEYKIITHDDTREGRMVFCQTNIKYMSDDEHTYYDAWKKWFMDGPFGKLIKHNDDKEHNWFILNFLYEFIDKPSDDYAKHKLLYIFIDNQNDLFLLRHYIIVLFVYYYNAKICEYIRTNITYYSDNRNKDYELKVYNNILVTYGYKESNTYKMYNVDDYSEDDVNFVADDSDSKEYKNTFNKLIVYNDNEPQLKFVYIYSHIFAKFYTYFIDYDYIPDLGIDKTYISKMQNIKYIQDEKIKDELSIIFYKIVNNIITKYKINNINFNFVLPFNTENENQIFSELFAEIFKEFKIRFPNYIKYIDTPLLARNITYKPIITTNTNSLIINYRSRFIKDDHEYDMMKKIPLADNEKQNIVKLINKFKSYIIQPYTFDFIKNIFIEQNIYKLLDKILVWDTRIVNAHIYSYMYIDMYENKKHPFMYIGEHQPIDNINPLFYKCVLDVFNIISAIAWDVELYDMIRRTFYKTNTTIIIGNSQIFKFSDMSFKIVKDPISPDEIKFNYIVELAKLYIIYLDDIKQDILLIIKQKIKDVNNDDQIYYGINYTFNTTFNYKFATWFAPVANSSELKTLDKLNTCINVCVSNVVNGIDGELFINKLRLNIQNIEECVKYKRIKVYNNINDYDDYTRKDPLTVDEKEYITEFVLQHKDVFKNQYIYDFIINNFNEYIDRKNIFENILDYSHMRNIYMSTIYMPKSNKYMLYKLIFRDFIRYKLYDVICEMNYANESSQSSYEQEIYLASMCTDNTPDTDTVNKVNIKFSIFLHKYNMLYLDDTIKKKILDKIKEHNIQCINDEDDNTIYNAIKATINTNYAKNNKLKKIFNIKEKYDDIQILYDNILEGFDKLLVVGELEEFTKLLCHNIKTPFVYIHIDNYIPDKKPVLQEKKLDPQTIKRNLFISIRYHNWHSNPAVSDDEIDIDIEAMVKQHNDIINILCTKTTDHKFFTTFNHNKDYNKAYKTLANSLTRYNRERYGYYVPVSIFLESTNWSNFLEGKEYNKTELYETINKEINNSKGFNKDLDEILNISYNNITTPHNIERLKTLIQKIRNSKPQRGGYYNYIQNKCSYYKLLYI